MNEAIDMILKSLIYKLGMLSVEPLLLGPKTIDDSNFDVTVAKYLYAAGYKV